jgi:hypothetical protein
MMKGETRIIRAKVYTKRLLFRCLGIALAGLAFLSPTKPEYAFGAGEADTLDPPEPTYFPLITRNHATGLGGVEGTVRDAQTGAALDEVLVCLADSPNCDETDLNGHYAIPGIPNGFQHFEATDFDFTPLTKGVLVLAGQTSTLDFVLSAMLEEGQYRVVVTWGNLPRDLDAHLWTPDVSLPHVFWGERGTCPSQGTQTTACLDRDDTNGHGPETITIFESTVQPSGDNIFHYAVLNYSLLHGDPGDGPPLTQAPASVQLYDASGLMGEFHSPPSGSADIHDLWYVFDLDGPTGTITPINCYTVEPPQGSTPSCLE